MKTKCYAAFSIILITSVFKVYGQTNTFPSNGNAGIGTTIPNASSILEMKSTTQGVLIPRMTRAKRDSIASPATGLMIYQTNSTPGFYYFDGSQWTAITPSAANKSLSNLTEPTTVHVDLLPFRSDSVSLGSSSYGWQDIYTSGSYYILGQKALRAGLDYNTFVGFTYNTTNTGDYNTFLGNNAGRYTTSSYNTAVGTLALNHTTTGADNTALGVQALISNTTGNHNTGIGYNALNNTTAADYNTAEGYKAGDTYNNGYNNVFLGANTDVNGIGYYNVIAIGQGTICTASSQVTMGNGATDSYRAYANWSNISDGRYKKNMKENVPGLQSINKLKPVTYTLDATGINNFLHKNSAADQLDENEKAANDKALKAKEQIRYTGFVAQEVEKAAKEIGYDFSGVDAAKNENDVYALRYAEFVVPLVKAVQELSKMNDELNLKIGQFENLKIENNEQEKKITELQKQIDELRALFISQNKPLRDTKQTASN